MVHWFCLTSWRLFDIWTPNFEIMSQYDVMFDLKVNVGHCDLYFMVQWFCLISWRLFDVWTSYFRIMSWYDLTFDLKINVGCCGISWSSDFAIHFGRLIYEHHTLGLESVWPGVRPKINMSPWPIFHGPVTLPYILKTLWYMNTIVWDYKSVWPSVWP